MDFKSLQIHTSTQFPFATRQFTGNTHFSKIIFLFLLLLGISAGVQAQFTQQAGPLVGTGAIGEAAQGSSVSVSGDGNTAIVVLLPEQLPLPFRCLEPTFTELPR